MSIRPPMESRHNIPPVPLTALLPLIPRFGKLKAIDQLPDVNDEDVVDVNELDATATEETSVVDVHKGSRVPRKYEL
jgi:hypothetical protein